MDRSSTTIIHHKKERESEAERVSAAQRARAESQAANAASNQQVQVLCACMRYCPQVHKQGQHTCLFAVAYDVPCCACLTVVLLCCDLGTGKCGTEFVLWPVWTAIFQPAAAAS